MKFNVLLIMALSSLLGCKKDFQGENNYAYFGGEIINPNNNYVVLNSPEKTADTLYLDANNRFLHKLENLKPGLYTFMHGGEFQRVLIEPKDSILLRLNTIDFDESMVFTGDGARKNNYLISMFIQNETDNKKFMDMMWGMEPEKFEQALDSNRNSKLTELKDFISHKEYSNYFKSISESNINYDYYSYKELYPFSYYGYNNLIHYKDLPTNFYDFRKNVDYNNEDLIAVIPYSRFLFCHFNNLALGKFYETATNNVVFDNQSVVYNLEKLQLMDSVITNKNIKNYLLKYTTKDFITISKDSSETKEVLNSFLAKSTDEKDKVYMKDLTKNVNNLKPGNKLPNVKLRNYHDTIVDSDSIITKPTVIYFWSSNFPLLLRNSHFKAKIFRSKFPGFNFIAININDDDKSRWANTIKQYHFPIDNEYQLQDTADAMRKLVINSVNRSIFVDSDGTIINSNAMMFTSEFEEELERILHKKEAHH
ncbi:MAG: hypothetical protein ABIO60_04240 [Aquaticitalea sp.]